MSFNPKWIEGKTIERVEMNPYEAGSEHFKKTAHNPHIFFTDGFFYRLFNRRNRRKRLWDRHSLYAGRSPMTKVWVYPERKFEELGAVRFQLSWEEVKKSSQGKNEIDPDVDLDYCFLNFNTKEAALAKGQEIVDAYRTAYGAASVQKQVVDWYVEEDRVAEWVNAGDSEEVS